MKNEHTTGTPQTHLKHITTKNRKHTTKTPPKKKEKTHDKHKKTIKMIMLMGASICNQYIHITIYILYIHVYRYVHFSYSADQFEELKAGVVPVQLRAKVLGYFHASLYH